MTISIIIYVTDPSVMQISFSDFFFIFNFLSIQYMFDPGRKYIWQDFSENKVNRSFASCNAIFFSFSRYDISWLLTKWKNMPERAMHFPKKETWKYYNIIWNSAPCCYVISCFPFYIFFIFFSFMEKKASIFIAYIENCSSVSVDNAI